MSRSTGSGATDEVWTVGHSTRSWDAFVALLERERMGAIADVRAFPGSRRHPQFDRERMAPALTARGIEYHHLPELGGRRRAPTDAPPTAWRNAGFHAYATYMASAEFEAGMQRLLALARERRTAILCSEAVPWRCHRNLVADALTARGTAVLHIGDRGVTRHTLTPFAVVQDGRVRYPAESAAGGGQLDLPV